MKLPITVSDYYDFFPSNSHTPGDIWSALPTFGVLPLLFAPGLIVTPACDLANRKVETLTYIPIVSIPQYLVARDVLPDIIRTTEGQLQACSGAVSIRQELGGKPGIAEINAVEAQVEEIINRPNASQKAVAAGRRACAGIKLIRAALTGSQPADATGAFQALHGEGEFRNTCKRIVTNSWRLDIHFLPADNQPSDWSAINEHSIALFRYPLTLPIDLLDLTYSCHKDNWLASLHSHRECFPCAETLAVRQPLKILRVKPRFMSDILTRFISLYGRLGSPDFTSDTVDRYINEIAGAAK